MTPEELRDMMKDAFGAIVGGGISDAYRSAADIAEEAATRIESILPGEKLAPETCRGLAEIYRQKANQYDDQVEELRKRIQSDGRA